MDMQTKVGHTNKYAGMSKGNKQKAKELAAYYNCTSNYSGNKKTLYIHGDDKAMKEAKQAIDSQLPDKQFEVECQ